MKSLFIFYSILVLDAFILFYQTSQLSISYHEASLLYGDFSFLQKLIQISIYYLGQNDFALRLPMIILHLLSVILLYNISKKYINRDRVRLWLVAIFILIPGVISSAILVDNAGVVIFSLLFLIYVYQNFHRIFVYLLLGVYLFVSANFLYLFLSLIFYAKYIKNQYLFYANIIYFLASLFLFGVDTQGVPKGHFIDLLGLYAAVLTPIIFVYIFYVLYRKYLTKEIDIIWFIAVVPFLVSLILSFRQRIDIEIFAPYLIISLPLAAQVFASTYRVRLKIFRKKYKLIFFLSFSFLIMNTFIVLFNKEIYFFLDEPKRNFSYKMHVAKELANELKKNNIDCVSSENSMEKRLQFYGINHCNRNFLYEGASNSVEDINVTISYKYKVIYTAFVTKVNK